jgi:hypothetical protein
LIVRHRQLLLMQIATLLLPYRTANSRRSVYLLR